MKKIIDLQNELTILYERLLDSNNFRDIKNILNGIEEVERKLEKILEKGEESDD